MRRLNVTQGKLWWVLWALLPLACSPGLVLRSPELANGSVVFRYRSASARIVQVSGSWETNFQLRGRDATSDQRVGLMKQSETTGIWERHVDLEPGRYEYLFLVDGRFWQLDPFNPQRTSDGSGGQVSVLVVP